MATTSKKHIKSASKSPSKGRSQAKKSILGWEPRSVIEEKSQISAPGSQAVIEVYGAACPKPLKSAALGRCAAWQPPKQVNPLCKIVTEPEPTGPRWSIICDEPTKKKTSHHGLLEKSDYSYLRDVVGSIVAQMAEFKVQSLKIVFRHGNHHEIVGSLVGLELASYEYRRATQNLWNRMIPARIEIKGARPNQLAEAARNGTAINISRHLVNAPAGDLNPETYELAVRTLFSDIKGVKISSIVGDKLLKENMNLIHAVGVGANTEPRMIRISYRPKSTKRPIALVGKGVTFDTGGLNMKPSAGMRLMKKDMGGSAAVCGASWNLAGSGSSQPFDAYLALAENSVDRHAYHPGDILTARNGKTVEIHNTDAEGRLVMADVLDYAITATGKDQPSLVVNVATLTGAIKVALGSELAGLFSNNDKLSDALVASSVTCGDRLWRMPLVQEYRAMIASPMADMLNSATTGFGGAITAGLFLESFVGSCPWAHIDIYAWTDRPQGALREVGASGQGVQLLSHWLGALK